MTQPSAWPSAATDDEYVRAQTLNAVYRQAALGPLTSLVAAALVVIGVRHASAPDRLGIWVGAIVVVSVLRMALLIAYRRRDQDPAHIRKWERAFLYSLLTSSIVWGIGALLVMPNSVTHEVLIYFFLAMIAGSTVGSYSAYPVACVLALVSLIVPVTVWFALHDVIELRVMAVGGAVYLIAASRATWNYGSFWRRSFQLSWELRQAHDRVELLARSDELTGINNRRAFLERGGEALAHARRYHRPLALVVLDIDHFKAINDTYGHAAGDRVLQIVGREIRRVVRAPDIAGRLGGEEFGIVLPETDRREAVVFAERLRADLAALQVPYEGATIRFTCSVGIATRGAADGLDTMLKEADAAMYRAKREGRNRVSVAPAGAGAG